MLVERLRLAHVLEPQLICLRAHPFEPRQAVRPRQRMKGDHYQPGQNRTAQPGLPRRGRPPGQPQHQRPAKQCIRQPHGRQSIAYRRSIGVGCEQDEAERGAPGQACRISRQPHPLVAVDHPEQDHRTAGQREIDQRFQPNAERQCPGQPQHRPAARAPRVGNPRDAHRQERQLPPVMVNPRRDKLPGSRPGKEQADDRQRPGGGMNQPPHGQRQRDH